MSSSHSSAERIGPVNPKPEAERSAEIEFQSQLAMRFFMAFSMLSNVTQNGSCNLSENLAGIPLGPSLAHEEHFRRDAQNPKKVAQHIRASGASNTASRGRPWGPSCRASDGFLC